MTNWKMPRPAYPIGLVLALAAAFWLFMPWWVPEWALTMVRASQGALASLVVFTYGVAIWQFKAERHGTAGHMLTIGIMVSFAGVLWGAGFYLLWQYYERPLTWALHPPAFFGNFLTSIACIFHLLAPGSIDDHIPRKGLWRASIAIAIGLAGAGALIASQVDPRVIP
jgi:hypothetical protein